MDYQAVEKFSLPIELMMENAGLQLARLVSRKAEPNGIIYIGAGNGNNGGGGLVAARRLAGWGFEVFLDLPVPITKDLPLKQLERALAFGAKKKAVQNPDIWVDAYLGFSQRLPLPEPIQASLERANASKAFRISLDIPTGISEDMQSPVFEAHQVLTLAAPKQILEQLTKETEVFVADLGIPKIIYDQYEVAMPQFHIRQIQ